jgi:hypothetical protein
MMAQRPTLWIEMDLKLLKYLNLVYRLLITKSNTRIVRHASTFYLFICFFNFIIYFCTNFTKSVPFQNPTLGVLVTEGVTP